MYNFGCSKKWEKVSFTKIKNRIEVAEEMSSQKMRTKDLGKKEVWWVDGWVDGWKAKPG